MADENIFEEMARLLNEKNTNPEDFPNGAAENNAPATPKNNQALNNGDSVLEDGSSGPVDPIKYLTLDDIRGTEEDVAKILNEKLSEYGLSVGETNTLQDLDAISIKKGANVPDDNFLGSGWLEDILGNPNDLFDSISPGAAAIGEDLTEEELQKNLDKLNLFIKENADLSFVEKAKKRSNSTYVDKYLTAIKPKELSAAEQKDGYTKDLIKKFENLTSQKATSSDGVLLASQPQPTINDFKDKEEFNNYKLWKENKPMTKAKAEDVIEWDSSRKSNRRNIESGKFINDLEPEERLDVMALLVNDRNELENFAASYEKFQVESIQTTKAIENYKANPSLENYKIAQDLNFKTLQDQTRLQEMQNRALESGLVDRAEKIPEAIADFGKNYNNLQQLRSGFKGLGTSITYGALVMGQMLGDRSYFDNSALVNAAKLNDATGIVNLSDSVKKEAGNFQSAITLDQIESLSDTGQWVTHSAINMVPSLAMAATGPAALPLFFLSGSGSAMESVALDQKSAAERMLENKKWLDNNQNGDPLQKMQIESQMTEDGKLLNISNWRVLSNAGLAGVAEVIFEKVGTIAIWKSLKAGIKGIPIANMKDGISYAAKQIVKGTTQEGGSEFATTLIQNWGNIFLLDEDKNLLESITDEKLFEGGLESFAQGALMGGSMKTINAVKGLQVAIASTVATNEQKADMKVIIDKLRSLTGKEIQSVDDIAAMNLQLPADVQKMVDKTVEEGGELMETILQGIQGNLSAEQLYELGELDRQKRLLYKQLEGATQQGLSASQLAAYQKQLKNEYDAVDDKKEKILGNKEAKRENLANKASTNIKWQSSQGYKNYSALMLNESLVDILGTYSKQSSVAKQQGFAEAREKLTAEGKPFTEADVSKRAENDFVKNTYAKKIEASKETVEAFAEAEGLSINIVEANSIAETIKAFEDNAFNELKESSGTTVNGKELTVRELIEAGMFEGGAVGKGGLIIVNKDVAAKNGRIGIYAHEVLHFYAKQKYGESKDAIDAAGKDLLSFLEKNDPDIYAKVKFRVDSSYTTKDANNEVTELGENYYEEVLTAMSDVLADGQKVTPQTLNSIREFANSFLNKLTKSGSYFKKDEGFEAYIFVRDYNQSAFSGKKYKGTDFIKSTDDDKSDEETSKDPRTKLSLSSAKESLGNIDVKDLKGAKAQTEIAMELPGMALAQVLGRFNLAPKVAAEMRDAVVEKIYLAQETTKWDGRGQLYGFINGRIALRIKDIVKEEYNRPAEERQFLSSVDGLQAEDQKGLAVSEAPVRAAEKPKYKNLVQSKVVSTDALKSIMEKVVTTVRTLKSRVDAKTSINKTISPLIAEIKKEMGKQADIDLKKEIGGKKDDQIKKYLLANKKAILENMTTTWLMQAMPGAIQKQVDGKFTSDWEGKKIDREKVSTNNAGKTSGAEIARRLPNPSVSLDDATFLGYIIDGKGAPIRGRKESLAKAMAEEISFDIFSQQIKNPDSDLSKAFEKNQTLLGVELLDNYVQEFNKQAERGTVKFSFSPQQLSDVSLHLPQLKDILINQNAGKVTKGILRNAMTRVYIDENTTSLTPEFIKKFADDASLTVGKYFKKVKDINVASFKNFVLNGVLKLQNSTNLLKTVGITADDIFGSYVKLGDTQQVIERRRALEQEYNIKLVEQKGKKGVELIMQYMKGHNSTSTKIGGGRGQYYASVSDYYDNNLANIPGVTIKGKKVFYKGELISGRTPSQKVYKTVDEQKVPISEAEFAEQYDERKASAKEAFDLMIDFLDFVRSKNDPVLWVATMKSLDSNMQTMLKASANVEYYYVGKTNAELRYEHIVPTNYMMIQLTNHFWNKKVDLDALQEAYSVAIIPKDMDENVNLQFQSTMPLKWDPLTDPSWYRYYNHTTFGMEYMLPIRKIGGKNKGEIFGEEWAKFNSIVKPNIAQKIANKEITDETIAKAMKFSVSIPAGISTSIPNFKGGFSKEATNLKAIFMVGGPGAGKTNVGKGLQLGRRGYKVVNQDIALEAMKTEAGLPAKESDYDAEQRSTRSKLGAAARKAAVAKFDKYADNGNGMVIDGTGASYNATTKKIKALQDKGFEVHMVVANTPLSTAIERNRARTERSLPDFVVEKTYDQVQESLMKYREDFGDRLYEINTESIEYGKALPSDFLKQVHDGVNKNIVTLDSSVKLSLSKEFNNMIERGTGTLSAAKFSSVVAKRRGARKGRFKVWMPTSLDDFKGLTSYVFAGKGRQGDADQKWFQDNLLDPYFDGIAAIEVARQTMTDDFKKLNKMFKPVVKSLGKLTKDGEYTNDQAIRIYLWDKAGYEVPGLSKRDLAKMLKHIENNPDLKAYADGALLISKQPKWSKPGSFWDAQTILSDLGNMTEKTGRKEYIAEFIKNSKEIFSVDNLNKIEAVYGTRQADALKDILYRMENGTNRPSGMNKNANRFNNWVNNSIGSIMFFNRRSALLQTLSTVNFINWSDNNPMKAAAAFANQPQFWKDFSMLFNSPKLKQRRAGLKSDINEAEIASAVKGSKNKAVAALSWLLKKGFVPTQMADSFAIASGGATFYRNRVNSLVKQGKTLQEAEAQAFKDFSKISEETQQSGDPALISSDQASTAGRMLLAFQNTPIQLNRSIKKSAQNIYNRRRVPGLNQFQSDVTHLSQIIYYGAIQNIIFSTLQNALFALLPGFDDEEPTDEELAAKLDEKSNRILNGIISTTLKGGFGIPGAVVDTIKNVIQEYNKQDEKGFTADHTYTILQAANLAPPIGSKLGKIYKGIQTNRFDKSVIENRGYDVTFNGKFNLSPKYSVLGNYIEGATNFPMARAVDEINSITEAFDTRNTTMQRIALGLGWKSWNVNARNEENDFIKIMEKAKKK